MFWLFLKQMQWQSVTMKLHFSPGCVAQIIHVIPTATIITTTISRCNRCLQSASSRWWNFPIFHNKMAQPQLCHMRPPWYAGYKAYLCSWIEGTFFYLFGELIWLKHTLNKKKVFFYLLFSICRWIYGIFLPSIQLFQLNRT